MEWKNRKGIDVADPACADESVQLRVNPANSEPKLTCSHAAMQQSNGSHPVSNRAAGRIPGRNSL